MYLHEISLRDPFVLAENGRYYMYGTRCDRAGGHYADAVDVYVSDDLENWTAPVECCALPEGFWATSELFAPEVHVYNGGYYMLVSPRGPGRRRGTHILCAESPMGPFVPVSPLPPTPAEFTCLDGTLYVEDGKPWMAYAVDWTQIHVGNIRAVPLTEDLTAPAGDSVSLLHATDAGWGWSLTERPDDLVCEGPFFWRQADGKLLMLWSGFCSWRCYGQAMAISESGSILGPWQAAIPPLYADNGGHGMVFRAFDGTLYLILHGPNIVGQEHPILVPVQETPDGLKLTEQK